MLRLFPLVLTASSGPWEQTVSVSCWWPFWWLLVVLLVMVSLESESSGFKGMGVADCWTWAVVY